jgi:co-chaperonin GroES (HSP10)
MQDDSGIVPLEFKVVVLPDESEVSKMASKANILVPDTAQGMYQAGVMTGVLVAASPHAFSYVEEWPEGARPPSAGDRVVFARYAGLTIKGKPYVNDHGREDRREYRVINDKDIVAILRFEA